jgi:cytidyltransferase-like protein
MDAKQVAVIGAFDDLRSRTIRFLQEAAQLGELTILLWDDPLVRELTGQAPKFPEAERAYFLKAVRYVSRVEVVRGPSQADGLPRLPGYQPGTWAVAEAQANSSKEAEARRLGIRYAVIPHAQTDGFPDPGQAAEPAVPSATGGGGARKKVVVTGCYDWFHSGHVRFFEEVSGYGDLYVIVGHDANIRLLKGAGHPLLPQAERRYVAGSIRYVKQALISSGMGWLDADPEIQRLKPDIYAVNEDGDQGGKRDYCAKQGLHYLVLKRTPAAGLPKRSSTDLRGF